MAYPYVTVIQVIHATPNDIHDFFVSQCSRFGNYWLESYSDRTAASPRSIILLQLLHSRNYIPVTILRNRLRHLQLASVHIRKFLHLFKAYNTIRMDQSLSYEHSRRRRVRHSFRQPFSQ
jgi:hypothetical protein